MQLEELESLEAWLKTGYSDYSLAIGFALPVTHHYKNQVFRPFE